MSDWNQLTTAEILDQLRRISDKEIELTLETEPIQNRTRPYSGHHVWRDGDGWEWCVFVDAGEWDYLQYVISDDEAKAEFSYTQEPCPDWYGYRPSHRVRDEVWGVAGHCGAYEKGLPEPLAPAMAGAEHEVRRRIREGEEIHDVDAAIRWEYGKEILKSFVSWLRWSVF